MFEIFDASAIFGINPYWLLIAVSWSLAWEGIALWKSAQKKSLSWFVIFLIVILFNHITLGILPILYIFLFSKLGGKKTAIKATMKKPKVRKKKRRKK